MDLGCVGKGIIGMDSALSMHDYCGSYISGYPTLLYDGYGYYIGIPNMVGVKEIGMPEKNEIVIIDGYKVTTPERALVDLLKFDKYSEFLPEVMIEIVDNGEVEKFRNYCKKYGLIKEFDELIKEAENWEF